VFNGRWQFSHPEVEIPGTAQAEARTRGVYPLTETLRNRNVSSKNFQQWIQTLLDSRPPLRETLPESVVRSLGLMSLNDAIRAIHNPDDAQSLQRARLRLKFEEVFLIQVDMLRRNRKRKGKSRGHVMPHVGPKFNDFYSRCLPFELTGAQKRVIKEIRTDLLSGRQMNRLVQGDVGSGKTLVALMAMLLAVDNGMQACMMAPTEILATQHYETISSMLAPIGVSVALLKGSTPAKERRRIHDGLRDGSLNILVGTHALIEDTVEFRNLGLAVIDEQHRFGVEQRARLWAKNEVGPHVLVMTATPIPRTLAMTVYGDLDVSVIDELPPGRKPIATLLRFEPQRLQVYQATYAQLRAGRQVYIVYPLIDENEKLDLRSLTEGYDIIRDTFRDFKVAYVHGRMKPDEKEYQMSIFASGEARILVATTVIE
ncbi:MAG: ATP-dependent DNA helicase RecG, partial [Muribaculaceae bacterium]|nr:ATP-dependent DNA helicase RecG [Muribaculaceae bacterium]